MRILPGLLILLLGALPLRAGTLTFDQIDCAGDTFSPYDVTEFGVTWTANNYYLNGYCGQNLLLGDDGFASATALTGNGFSVQQFDWSGGTDVDDQTLPFVTIEGYRAGTLVASSAIPGADLSSDGTNTGRSGSGTKFLSGFDQLDLVTFSLNYLELDGAPECNYDDASASCSGVLLDNIVVSSPASATPTPVPLPPAAMLLFGALGLMWRIGKGSSEKA